MYFCKKNNGMFTLNECCINQSRAKKRHNLQ